MTEFDFDYMKILEKIYIKDQIHSQSGFYYPTLYKIYVNHDKLNDIQKLIVSAHEFVHIKLMNSNLGIIIHDLNWLGNYLSWLYEFVANKEIEKFLLSKGIIDLDQQYTYVLNNDLIDSVYIKNEALVLIAKLCIKLDERIRALIDNSLLVQEGLATFMSLNMSTTNIYKDLIYIVNNDFDNSFLPALKNEQQKQKKYILSLLNNPYTDGYLIAENIQKKYGEKHVFLTGVLSHIVPCCEFDLVGMNDTEFTTLVNGVLNCGQRWRTISELDQAFFDNPYSNENLNGLMRSLRYGVKDLRKKDYILPAQFTFEEILRHPLVQEIEQLITIETDFEAIIGLAKLMSPFDFNDSICKYKSFLSYIHSAVCNRQKAVEEILNSSDPVLGYGSEVTERDMVTMLNKERAYNKYKELIRRNEDVRKI